MHYTLHCIEWLKKLYLVTFFLFATEVTLQPAILIFCEICRFLQMWVRWLLCDEPRSEARRGEERPHGAQIWSDEELWHYHGQSRNLWFYQNLLGSMNEISFRESFWLIVGWKSSIASFKSRLTFDQEVGPPSSTKGREVKAGEWRDPNENLISEWGPDQYQDWCRLVSRAQFPGVHIRHQWWGKQKIILESDLCYGTGCE